MRVTQEPAVGGDCKVIWNEFAKVPNNAEDCAGTRRKSLAGTGQRGHFGSDPVYGLQLRFGRLGFRI